jgi:hypothetical protein
VGRALLVAGLLLLTAGLLAFLLWPLFDCPECENEYSACLRCGDQRRVTPAERWLRRPSDPDLVGLLRQPIRNAYALVDVAKRQGQESPDLLDWRGERRFFYRAEVSRVERDLLLVALDWQLSRVEDGSPCRVLLYARTGEELDRLDVWLEKSANLQGILYDDGVILALADREPDASAYFVSRRGEPPTRVPREQWPPEWASKGLGWIRARSGRLTLDPP